EQGLERESLLQRTNGDEVWLGAQHEAADPDHPRALHRTEQERIRLFGSHPADRSDVVALLEENGVDVREVHELFDVDRPAPFRRDRVELGVGARLQIAARWIEASRPVFSLATLRARVRTAQLSLAS